MPDIYSNLRNLDCETEIFADFPSGKCDRAHLSPLYQKLYRLHYVGELSSREFTTLKWRIEVLTDLTPRIARGLGRYPDFILFTDAATTAPLIARVRPLEYRGAPRLPRAGPPPHGYAAFAEGIKSSGQN